LSSSRDGTIAAVFGALTGTAAGFVGVGGGEFRIPVLVQLLHFPLKLAGGVNLVVGLFTVALGVWRRWGQSPFTTDDLTLAAIMGIVSLGGASLGVYGRERMPARPLKLIVCGYLFVAGAWMLYEGIAHAEHVLMNPQGMARWLWAAAIGATIAIVSGILGIAGGEMRIPALLYLFGVPIIEAGTLSLAVSVPTVAAGAVTDRWVGGLPNNVLRIAVIMGVASAIGVLLGAALVRFADTHTIKAVLGIVLLLATVRLTATRVD
jgi:uncharacterized membrane protein YfcA